MNDTKTTVTDYSNEIATKTKGKKEEILKKKRRKSVQGEATD